MTRLNTALESVGAEFLVLGHLLIEGIPAHKNYINHPGYDLVAVNPEKNLSCRIQVKSRWATDARSFLVKNFDSDFIVLVALNRGYRHPRGADQGRHQPDFYVCPTDVVREAGKLSSGTWGRVRLKDVTETGQYLNQWSAIRAFLGLAEQNQPSGDDETDS